MRKLRYRTWKGILVLCILLLILEYIVYSYARAAAFGSLGEFDTLIRFLQIVMVLTIAVAIAAYTCASTAKGQE